MKDKLKEIEREALKDVDLCRGDPASIEELRVKYLGRKGIVTELFKKMNAVSPEEKPEIGRLVNILKDNLTKALLEKASSSGDEDEEPLDKIDVTLPGIPARLGRMHPITKTIEEITKVFVSLGFMSVEGPEIETERYNFEALNIPLEHPSRDAFDTFYLDFNKGYLLRSHTSPVQARFMEKNTPPLSIIVPGKVFRPDATDASHSFMFHQVEGLVVGEDIRFSDLKGTLALFAKQIFGEKTKMRFRPSFFPFTEPSAEVDISCIICSSSGKGSPRCGVCGGKGWLEILGAGMVNPKVFKKAGYDPERYSGFAFGMGVERIAMLRYGISDIRMFYENDVRFLRQF